MQHTEVMTNRVTGLSSDVMSNVWVKRNSSSNLFALALKASAPSELSNQVTQIEELPVLKFPCDYLEVARGSPRNLNLGFLKDAWSDWARRGIVQQANLKHHYAQFGQFWTIDTNQARNTFLIVVRADDATPRKVINMFPQAATIQSSAEAKGSSVTSPLALRILKEQVATAVDEESQSQASAAVNDALTLVRRADLGGEPKVMLSEDGILTLQWQKSNLGLALLFAGDGVASISFRRPGQRYAENGVDISVQEDLPQAFNDMLGLILS